MSLTVQFLSNIRGFLKEQKGDQLREWLLVEPPVPDQYHKLAKELRNGVPLQKLIDQHLPEEDDVPEGQGTSWPGFASFMKDYFEYWRDVNFEDLLGAHQLLTALTKYVNIWSIGLATKTHLDKRTNAPSVHVRLRSTTQPMAPSCSRRASDFVHLCPSCR
jgi:hypothetical protein